MLFLIICNLFLLPHTSSTTSESTQQSWNKDAVSQVKSSHIMLGYPDGHFYFTKVASRREAVVAFKRLLAYLKLDSPVNSLQKEELID